MGTCVRCACAGLGACPKWKVGVCACVHACEFVCLCVNKINESGKEMYFIPLHIAKKARLYLWHQKGVKK